MPSEMWPHFVKFFHSVNRWFFGSLGTTPLGWFVENIVLFLATLVVTLIVVRLFRGKAAMTAHVKENVLIGSIVYVVVFVSLWGFLYTRSLIHAIYDDHESLVHKVKEVHQQGLATTGDIQGSLTAQLDTLKLENASLKNELERKRHYLDTNDPAFHDMVEVANAFRSWRAMIGWSAPCQIKITAPNETQALAMTVSALSNMAANCAVFGPSPTGTSPDVDKETFAGMKPDKLLIHAPRSDRAANELEMRLMGLFQVARSYDTPSDSPSNFVWLQFGTKTAFGRGR